MFDISWSELLILAVVALIVVGPKELPTVLRTLGRYAGMARRQAAEFRSHFEEAMREAEMAELREEMEGVRREVMDTAQSVERKVTGTAPPDKLETPAKAKPDTTPEPEPLQKSEPPPENSAPPPQVQPKVPPSPAAKSKEN